MSKIYDITYHGMTFTFLRKIKRGRLKGYWLVRDWLSEVYFWPGPDESECGAGV